MITTLTCDITQYHAEKETHITSGFQNKVGARRNGSEDKIRIETRRVPTGFGINSLDSSWERDGLADMFDAADPGGDTLGAHAEDRSAERSRICAAPDTI